MTFTTRDKILLGVLAVILFVGMMYLYGVMPANEEADKLASDATKKQQELNELLAKIAAINIDALDDEYDELLDYYYTTKESLEGVAKLPEEVEIIALERKIVKLLDDNGIKGYSTTSWKINRQQQTASYDGESVMYEIVQAVCPVPFKVAPEVFHDFIGAVHDNEFYSISDLSVTYSVETHTTTDEGGNDVTTTEKFAEGNFTLNYFMAARTEQANLPKLLPEVAGLAADGATLTFNTVDNAVGYEFYTVSASGTVTAVPYMYVKDNGEATLSVKFSSNYLTAGVHTVAVRAVGDKSEGYFKSPLPDKNTETVLVTV